MFSVFIWVAFVQGMLTAADTYYVFNHVEIIIEYHTSLDTDWGLKAPDGAVRLVRAKLEPKRFVRLHVLLLSPLGPVVELR